MRHAEIALLPALASLLGAGGCTFSAAGSDTGLHALPAEAGFCLAAARLVTRTAVPMELQVHSDFDAFVKSKALIEGPTLQQFNWNDDQGRLVAISCKLKSADHLVAAFGPGSAGPDGTCQDMNRAVYALVVRDVRTPTYDRVIFDSRETVANAENPGMTGPDWLAPFTLTSVDPDGTLRVHTKGFIVGFSDPQFAMAPVRFRGVHYCHFIAPQHLRDLLENRAQPGAMIGRNVQSDGSPTTPDAQSHR